MSADNRIARSARDVDQPTERSSFEIPPELTARYEVRVIDALGGERRLGLFRPGEREMPAIEITGDRILARSEDAETVASLVKIAQHNGWEKIDVEGSPEFRRAVWTAATREGLAVGGYEPTVAEQERTDELRREAAARREREASERPSPTPKDEGGDHRHESQELAELFLHGAADEVGAEPRLSNAVQAQAVMEQHIGEVFGNDVSQMASANLESRQLISDALRRGLDVSVRELTPVRQIEPMQTRPDLER